MSFPTGIQLREVTFGVPFGLADGGDLIMVVTFTPNRSMVWGALGFPGIAREYRVESSSGMQASVSLPVTDQAGWLDGLGNVIAVTGGAQTHVYTVAIRFQDLAGKFVADVAPKNMALPTGDLSPVDLDTLLPVSTTGGVTVSIPDSWSQAVADARAAALAAGTQAVGGFLSGNLPNPGVNQAAFSNAMLARAPIYWQPNTVYGIGTLVLAPDGSTVKALATFTSGATYNAANWSVVVASAAAVAAAYVSFGPSAPDPTKAPVWVDTSATPQVVKGYVGGIWTAIGGGGAIEDGSTSTSKTWSSSKLSSALSAKADLVGGFIPTAQIPALALTTAVPVASRSAMLALASGQVQPGDVAIDTSAGATRGSYMLAGADPSTLSNWILLNAPTDVVSSVNGQQGTIVLSKADVGLGNVNNTADVDKPVSTAMQAALDAKATKATFNVRDYGAVPDNTLDCTTAFQTAVAAAAAVNGTVIAPASALGLGYKLTDTIMLAPQGGAGQVSINIRAEGANSAAILWAGGSNKAVFASSGGLIGSVFENVKVRIPNTATGVVAWDFYTSVGGYINSVTWRNARVDLGTGTNNIGFRLDHLSGPGADVSFITWDNCSVAGGGTTSGVTIAGQRGWSIEGANSLNFVFIDGGGFFLEKNVTNVSTSGATSAQGGGSIYTYGFGGGYNGVEFEIGNFGTYGIFGGRFELGKRFLTVTYGGNSPAITVANATISDYTPSDGCLFRLSRPACLKLDNCSVDGATSDFTSAMIYVGGPAGGQVIVDGGLYSASDPFWSTYPGDAAWSFASRNVSLADRGSLNRTGPYLSGSAAVQPSITHTSTARTVASGDLGARVDFTNSAASTLTIPTDAAMNAPIGAFLHVEQGGAGQVGIAGASGVTVRAPSGTYTAARYARLTVTKRAANEWVISGNATSTVVVAPTFQVASSSTKEQSTGSTITPTVPTGTAAGDLLILSVVSNSGAIATPSGWTQVQTAQPYQGGHTMGVYYKAATGSDTMPAITVGASSTAIVYRITAANTSALGSDVTVVGAGDGTSAYFNSVTTTASNTLLLQFMASLNTVAPVKPSSSTAGPADTGTGYRLTTAYETIAAAGASGARTWTAASTTRLFGVMFAVQGA